MDWGTDGLCGRLLAVLGPQHDVVRRWLALPHREVAVAIERVRAGNTGKVDTLPFELPLLTVARVGKVLGDVWSETDRDACVWPVPASRMKTAREHLATLSGRALEILDVVRKLGDGGSPIFFVNELARALGEKWMVHLLPRHRIAVAPRFFRLSFPHWSTEETDHPREFVVAAGAHVVRNKVETPYRRNDLFDRRRRLMDDWATYLAKERRDPEARS